MPINSDSIEKVEEMYNGLIKWLNQNDYYYYEINHVPSKYFTNNHYVNLILRTIFRLSPINMRPKMSSEKSDIYTPQSLVSLLKAYNVINDKKIINILNSRINTLRSKKTINYALKQGIRIAVNHYENDIEDPTPLNTAWYGEYLLSENDNNIPLNKRKELLQSISEYFINELGFYDHEERGIYFYYGPTLKKEIINASSVISSFLIRAGRMLKNDEFISLGERGIKYVVNRQNSDGSWYYMASPGKPSIDNFHQAYILKSLLIIQEFTSLDLNNCINKGLEYYQNKLFQIGDKYLIPIRYDKRYIPRNTWIFQKVDTRDVVEALIVFSVYRYNENYLEKLIKYAYDKLYDKKEGSIACEITLLWKNRITYLEYQGWMLYALAQVRNLIRI